MLAAVALGVRADDPWTPAATNWGKLPPVAAPPLPSAPVTTPPAARPPAPNPLPKTIPTPPPASDRAPGTVPGRVVTFQKPAGNDNPMPAGQPRPASNGTGVPGQQPMPPVAPPPKAVPQPSPPVDVPPAKTPAALCGLDQAGPFSKANVFRLESEGQLRERIVRELVEEQRRNKKPEDKPITADFYQFPPVRDLCPPELTYRPKTLDYPPMRIAVEPGYVVHRRLYFEELNSERHGWDLGFVQPVVSTLAFYKDTLLWPSRLASNVFERYDTSAGKCLPGSPVPYYLYPPEVDLFGVAVGGGFLAGMGFLFP